MIHGISHTNIRVRDIDKCLPFYVDVLNLKISLDDGKQAISGGDFHGRRAVYLRWDLGRGQSFVVLQSFPEVGPNGVFEPIGYDAKLTAMGLNHFGFWVDNLDEFVLRATRAGVHFVREAPVTCFARHYGYADTSDEPCVRTVQLADPENNVIQLDQWIKPRPY